MQAVGWFRALVGWTFVLSIGGRVLALPWPAALEEWQDAMPPPMFEIGERHPDTRTTPEQVLELATKAGEGDARAMVRLGIAYECGQGVSADHDRAFELYKSSALKGDSLGCSRLAWAYICGIGVDQDMETGRRWVIRAANGGNSFSRARAFAWGWVGPGGFREAYRWYRKSAEEGDPRGAYFTGKYLGLGRAVKKDVEQAARWQLWGAEMGDPPCMQQIGNRLFDGDGVRQDPVAAMKWLRESATRGDVRGMYSLGWRYYHGKGTEANPGEAVRWWVAGAASRQVGRDASVYGLGRASFEGKGIEKNAKLGEKYYLRAIALGNEHAMFRLGRRYRRGEDVGENKATAAMFFVRGARLGHKGCERELREMHAERLAQQMKKEKDAEGDENPGSETSQSGDLPAQPVLSTE